MSPYSSAKPSRLNKRMVVLKVVPWVMMPTLAPSWPKYSLSFRSTTRRAAVGRRLSKRADSWLYELGGNGKVAGLRLKSTALSLVLILAMTLSPTVTRALQCDNCGRTSTATTDWLSREISMPSLTMRCSTCESPRESMTIMPDLTPQARVRCNTEVLDPP